MLQKIRVGRLLLGFGLAWFCLLLWPAPAWAEDGSAAYVQRDGGRIYTVINTVRVENRSSRLIRNINLEVPLASNQSVHWQDVLGEELFPQPQSIDQAADGSRTAHYLIEELPAGQSVELVQRVAVQNYCVTYDVSEQDSALELEGLDVYLAPSDEINSDSSEIISFAKAATAASANPYLQARLLFSAVNGYLTYDNTERESRSAQAAYAQGSGNCVDYANLYAATLRAMGIPARVCGGFLYDPTVQLDNAFLSPKGHINADRLRHNWVEFYIKGVGWLVADPTFSYRDGDSSGQMTDWSRFANIVNSHRLIYTCEYLPDNNSVIYNYQGAAPLISYSSELALYSVISPFTDLTNNWAAEAVLGLYYNTPPLVNGLSESYFGVGENLTRAQFAALLNRALDRVAPLPDGALADKLYTDIATGHWAYDDIYKAAARGLLSGYTDGTVRPDAYITRAEAAVMLDRIIGGGDLAAELPYVDMQQGYAWARTAVGNLYRLGIMHGVAPDTFAPNKLITRGEGAAIIYRWLQSDVYYEKYFD